MGRDSGQALLFLFRKLGCKVLSEGKKKGKWSKFVWEKLEVLRCAAGIQPLFRYNAEEAVHALWVHKYLMGNKKTVWDQGTGMSAHLKKHWIASCLARRSGND